MNKKVNIVIGETTETIKFSCTTIYAENIDDSFVIDIVLPENYDDSKQYPSKRKSSSPRFLEVNYYWNHSLCGESLFN